MSGIWKNNIGLSIFGESHGPAIGITLSGFPVGLALDLDFIRKEMARRRPGQSDLTTSRDEKDKFEILSGVVDNVTTGAPLTIMIRNTNTRSRDYEGLRHTPRPGHADYTGTMRYSGFQDIRGGGHFSGRLTAGLVFAGAVAKQVLSLKGIYVGAKIDQISTLKDQYKTITKEQLEGLNTTFPVIDEQLSIEMQDAIRNAKAELDSVGGVVRCFAFDVPAGLGNPFFESFESNLAQLLFSVPAVKGVQFGNTDIASLKGSQANDPYIYDDGVKTSSNNNGGIIGGITTGMPVEVSVSIKPTASIGQVQKSIDLRTNDSVDLEIEGRHDPCIVPRVLPVIESVMALTILDLL